MFSNVFRIFAAVFLCSNPALIAASFAADLPDFAETAGTSGAPVVAAAPVTPMTPDVVPNHDAFLLDRADYVKRVEMVPMRDGVKLYTVILFKKGAAHAPILLSRNADRNFKRPSRIGISNARPVQGCPQPCCA